MKRQWALVSVVGLCWFLSGCGSSKPLVVPSAHLADEDGDGVLNEKDMCPGTPPGSQVDERGCVMMDDSDADGVTDDRDACPSTLAGVKVDTKGCPVESPPVVPSR